MRQSAAAPAKPFTRCRVVRAQSGVANTRDEGPSGGGLYSRPFSQAGGQPTPPAFNSCRVLVLEKCRLEALRRGSDEDAAVAEPACASARRQNGDSERESCGEDLNLLMLTKAEAPAAVCSAERTPQRKAGRRIDNGPQAAYVMAERRLFQREPG